MGTKHTTINFFQIVPKDTNLYTAINIQEKLRNLEATQFLSMPLTGKVLIMTEPLIKRDTYFVGSIYHIQMSNIPPSMNTQTLKMSGLQLGDLDGLAKATCFLLDPQANILVIESGTGVSEKALCKYFKFNSDLPNLEAAVIINPGQVQQFYKMGTIFQFEARMAKVNDGGLFSEGKSSSIAQILDSADETNTDKLTYKIEISPQHKKENKSLNKGKISNFIDRFLRYKETEEVESLKVLGKIEGEERTVTLELIKERLHDYIEYDIEDRLIVSYKIHERYSKIEEVYARHRQSLLRTYKLEGDN